MRSPSIIFHNNAQFASCPSCKSHGSLRKSKSHNNWEQFVTKFTFFRYYRCRECGWRGTKSNYTLTSISFKNLITYIIVAAVAGYLVKFILTNFIIK